MVAAEAHAPVDGWVTRVATMWLLPPFQKQLIKRQRETQLLEQLSQCVEYLYSDPRHSGLKLETLANTGAQPILSARIDRNHRLILTPLPGEQVGLLYFDSHDEAYEWVRRKQSTIPTMLANQREVPRGMRFGAGAAALPAVRADEDSEIAIASATQFRQMVDGGITRYLTFLDDEQRHLAELNVRGLLLVKGGAGTGKTAVAIHRLLKLAAQPSMFGPNRVLYLCYNSVLAHVVDQLVVSLCGGKRPDNVEIRTFHGWCLDFLREWHLKTPGERERDRSRELVASALASADSGHLPGDLSADFVFEEIRQVIKYDGLTSREQYLRFNREGRGTGLKEAQRSVIWDVHEASDAARKAEGFFDWDDLPGMALEFLDRLPLGPRFRGVVVDEGQDCTPVMMRLARRLVAEGSPLTVFADPAQAIYAHGFHWTQRELRVGGGNVRWLRANYRTTREIYALATPLLKGDGSVAEDVAEMRAPERSSKKPTLFMAADRAELLDLLADRIRDAAAERPANQIAVLGWRSVLRELAVRLDLQSIRYEMLDRGRVSLEVPSVKLLTPESAKGLDFPVVFVVPSRRDDASSDALSAESRRKLYVSLTRASEQLTIGAVYESHPLLLEILHAGTYAVDGSRAREFAGTRGMRSQGSELG